MRTKQSILVFWIFIISVFFIIISPLWLSHGMFLDGLFYADIARNLSLGKGSFWNLHYSVYQDAHFTGHPPLVFAIEASLFKIFGDSVFVEKIYSVFTYLLSGALIVAIWNEISATEYKKYSWFVVFLWIIFPVTTWAAVNNMLENTMTVFLLCAIFFAIKDIKTGKILYTILSGIFIFAAFMSKGPVGLFPLSFYFWYWLSTKKINFGRMFSRSVIITFIPVFLFLVIYFLNSKARCFFDAYYQKQIVLSMNHHLQMYGQNLMVELLKQLIPLSIITIILKIFKKKDEKTDIDYRLILFFLLLSLSAVVPLSFGGKQRTFYLIPALPLLAIAFALWLVPDIENFSGKLLSKKWFYYLSYSLLALAILSNIYFFNKIGRDRDIILDAKQIANVCKPENSISVSKELYRNWKLQAYFMRYDRLSLSCTQQLQYLLSDKKEQMQHYRLVDTLHLRKFFLYKLKN